MIAALLVAAAVVLVVVAPRVLARWTSLRRAPRAATLPLRTQPAPGGANQRLHVTAERHARAAAANPRTGRGGPRSEGRGLAG